MNNIVYIIVGCSVTGIVALLVWIIKSFYNKTTDDSDIKEALKIINTDIKELKDQVNSMFKTIIEDYTKKKDFEKLGNKFDLLKERVVKIERDVEIFSVQVKEFIKNEHTDS